MPFCGILHFIEEKFGKDDFSITLSDIRLRLSYPGVNGIILVEGASDLIILQPLFKANVFLLTPFCKNSAIKIIEQIGNSKKIIAVLDKDYSKPHLDERVFYYDGCNLEMMLISNDNFFNEFGLYYAIDKTTLINYRDTCLNKLKPFSCLRYLQFCGLENGEIKSFKPKESFPQLHKCLSLERQTFIDEITRNLIKNLTSKDLTVSDKITIQNYYINNLPKALMKDVYQITNGHDFNELFLRILQPKIKCSLKPTHPNNIYHKYASFFSLNLFCKTALYQKIKEYEIRNKLDLLN